MTKISDEKTSLKIAKMLFENDISKEDIENELKIKQSTFYKYLTLLKKCGFEIVRNHDNYRIQNYGYLFKFLNFEYGILSYMYLFAYILMPSRKTKIFTNVIKKISFLTNEKDFDYIIKKAEFYKHAIATSQYQKKMDWFDEYIENKKQVSVLDRYGRKLTFIPVDFDWKKDKICLKYYQEDRNIRAIPLDNIIKISKEDEETQENKSKETFFELYGKLSKTYRLKENERVVDIKRDSIVISNSTQDKTMLFRRLLRYDSFCKVIFPKADVLEFKKLIAKTLENIDKI